MFRIACGVALEVNSPLLTTKIFLQSLWIYLRSHQGIVKAKSTNLSKYLEYSVHILRVYVRGTGQKWRDRKMWSGRHCREDDKENKVEMIWTCNKKKCRRTGSRHFESETNEVLENVVERSEEVVWKILQSD